MKTSSPESPLSYLRRMRLKIREFASKVKRRGHKVSGSFEQADKKILQPLLPKHPEGLEDVIETPGDANGAVPPGRPRFKIGRRFRTRKGPKKKARRVLNRIGETVGNAVTPGLRDDHEEARQNLQLAYPPFMLSAGVFMFFF